MNQNDTMKDLDERTAKAVATTGRHGLHSDRNRRRAERPIRGCAAP
jgi:hypothetical protein